MRNRHAKVVTTPQTSPVWKEIAEKTAVAVPDEVFHSEYSGGKQTDMKGKLQIRTQRISIGLPMDELMFSRFLANFLALSIMPWDDLITTQSTYLPDARNQIHNVFLEKAEGTHLLMLDSDVLPPPNFITKMLMHNKPIVGGWYHKKEKFPVKDTSGKIVTIQRPVIYDYVQTVNDVDNFRERTQPGAGLEKVDGMGAGCWLMRRDVAEALGKSPYSMANGGGEDLFICGKIKNLGFDMYVDWDAACAHMGVFFV
jgi:hypothetical protein